MEHPTLLSPKPAATRLAPICAIFLAKFDVHTGYELAWFRSLNETIYPSKGLEFKALPSGLHSVETDIICFVQEKQVGQPTDQKPLLYGISVFRQNLSSLQETNGSIDRKSVQMYSLGVVIDPEHVGVTWNPKIYSSCWNYKDQLNMLVTNYVGSDNQHEQLQYLEQFWEVQRFKGSGDLNSKFKDIMKNVNINRRKSIQTLINDEAQNNTDTTTSAGSGTSAGTFVGEPSLQKIDDLNAENFNIDDDHMINSLLPLLSSMGPLIFRLWKLALLRKKIILYAPQGSHQSISGFSKIIYCVSLISSVPKTLRQTLLKSGVTDLDELAFNVPIYNVCVNDIGFLRNRKAGFIASTTDQIILEKTDLYDYSLRFPENDSEEPQIFKAGSSEPILATSRDFNRFKLVYANFFDNVQPLESGVDELEVKLPAHARLSTEPLSVREVMWKGLSWWATAGSSETHKVEFELEYELFDDVDKDEVEQVVSLLGYFQKLTIRLFTMLVDIINNSESEHMNEHTAESDSLVNQSSRDESLWIEPQDVYEMGMDPYSSTDTQVLVDLCAIWWGKEAKIGGYLGNYCCI
ncbi:hypothetical protein OGAPHI_007343 [Ogataea philodendri]|uniref:DUF4484 domain-containing protein n=1 Tax=Ogataea philodendri TaxID=1378263 RepID=A0A9P8SYX1_9ASCO|nr:uncharacterized protein OGAPHI_007343 [Ogataea philodendri]KAH3660138.1 hypothetical protein OGAPHI_007343 [Ogataea philodendri]